MRPHISVHTVMAGWVTGEVEVVLRKVDRKIRLMPSRPVVICCFLIAGLNLQSIQNSCKSRTQWTWNRQAHVAVIYCCLTGSVDTTP